MYNLYFFVMEWYSIVSMKVHFFDINKTDIPDILHISVEALVNSLKDTTEKIAFISSANSIGFMNGGSDAGYMNAIEDIEPTVKKGIALNNTVSTKDRPYLHIGDTMGFFISENIFFVCAPVMFLPQTVLGTDNHYYALKSALQLCEYVGITTVYTPMMCTGVGGCSYQSSYDIMMQAVQDYKNDKTYTIYQYQDTTYIYNIQNDTQRQHIREKQAKRYMNIEFKDTFSFVI